MAVVSGERLSRLDLAGVRRWAVTARAALTAHRREIDDLNVFPVPDGDTGTNLLITLDAAVDAVRSPDSTRLEDVIAAFARATTESARGNSGVIASQLAQGISEVCREQAAGGDEASLDGSGLARALRRAHDLARAGVTRPVEGTMLTVARAAAEGAEAAARTSTDLYAVTSAALGAARDALDATREQLPVLRRAGVVDAGGAGYVVLLESLEHVVGGSGWTRTERDGWRAHATPDPGGDVEDGHEGGPAYEVMYLLEQTDGERVRVLRDALDGLGDSVLVVGGPQVWNVHAHVDDPGAAIEAGLAAGRPRRIAVTHFAATAVPVAGQVAVVACAAGPGLQEAFAAAGAAVVADEPDRRVSASRLLDAVREAASSSVLLLPDDAESLLAAEAAASAAGADGLDAHVVRARAAVQAIAAMAVFDPDATVQDNLLVMTGAAAGTRQGAVAFAGAAGDVRGLVEDEVVTSGSDPELVGVAVARLLLSAGGELLTLVAGAELPEGVAAAVREQVRADRPELEVTVLDGGQAAPALLLGVE
ncbi:MAG TPA: DAK2 domain-containing protein [Segeticoccus sp.]|nr:DAK2 domain-containing protein [Segeticoccus sp.]